jgi:ferredoxin
MFVARGVSILKCIGNSVCVYYCTTYQLHDDKLLAWGRGIVEDMCYERRRAKACVD